MSVNQDEFRATLGRFPSGVTVVTTKAADGSDQGMTVSAFCSVSLEPPLVLICIEKTASAYQALTTDIDRFEGVGFTRSSNGYVIIDDLLGVLECRRFALHDGGDHTIILGEVEETRVESGTPLLYYRGGYAQLEH